MAARRLLSRTSTRAADRFSNDPLLQGWLFSYTDTQLSRLGSINFHQLPINQAKETASRCPFLNQRRDGHMQMQLPKGRANYEPDSLAKAGEPAGYREDPEGGYKTFPSEELGQKLRIRPESFADHSSQARLLFRLMDPAEQAHIASALVFELSKVSLEHIRVATMAHLRNVASSPTITARSTGRRETLIVSSRSRTCSWTGFSVT